MLVASHEILLQANFAEWPQKCATHPNVFDSQPYLGDDTGDWGVGPSEYVGFRFQKLPVDDALDI